MELPLDLDDLIRHALIEDVGGGDVTSIATVDEGAMAAAQVMAKADGVIAGGPVFERVFHLIDPDVVVRWLVLDGTPVTAGALLGEVRGPARAILEGERVALNLLQHMSGVATLTRRFVDACGDSGAKILCTRKTLPGLRALERYAVSAGGGRLHRAGLDDGVLIKDNHVALAGGVEVAVSRARATAPHTLRVEVEVESIEQLKEALAAGADAILLDNADLGAVREAVGLVGSVPLEISGGVTLEMVPDIAACGPVLISVGRITHSAPALDISLDISS